MRKLLLALGVTAAVLVAAAPAGADPTTRNPGVFTTTANCGTHGTFSVVVGRGAAAWTSTGTRVFVTKRLELRLGSASGTLLDQWTHGRGVATSRLWECTGTFVQGATTYWYRVWVLPTRGG